MCVEMAKPEIQSTIFASRQLVTQRVKSVNVHAFYSFYTFINVEYQQNK